MKIALLGAFIFVMAFALVMYFIMLHNPIAILFIPLFLSIILVPIGMKDI
jgi:hypothetical protein